MTRGDVWALLQLKCIFKEMNGSTEGVKVQAQEFAYLYYSQLIVIVGNGL